MKSLNMLAWEHMITKTCDHERIWTSKHLNIGTCDHQCMYTCEHVIIKVSTNVSMLSTKHKNIQALGHESEQVCDCESIQAYRHLSTEVHIPIISSAYKHNHQSIWAHVHPTNMINYASKTIDISRWSCVHSCVDIKHVNVDASHQTIWIYEQVTIKASNQMRKMAYR